MCSVACLNVKDESQTLGVYKRAEGLETIEQGLVS